MIGKIYMQNPELYMHSPAFCRCEGRTFLFKNFLNEEKIHYFKIFFLSHIFLAKIVRDIFFIFFTKKISTNNINDKSILVFSFFDKRSIDNGLLKEEYFRDILDCNNNVICVYKFISQGFFKRGIQYTKSLENSNKKFKAFSEYAFIDLFIVFRAIFNSIIFIMKIIYKRNKMQLNSKLKKYLLKEVIKEFLTGIIYQNYLQNLLYKKLLTKKPKVILHVWENQPWNRILEFSKNKYSPNSSSRGFQHTGFSKKLLQHYPSKFEKNLDSLPDIIISNGRKNQTELNKIYSKTKIVVGGALRQNILLKKKLSPPKELTQSNLKEISFAFSWDQSDYDKIIEGLRLIPKNIKIFLKFHPNYPNWSKKNNFPKNFFNSNLSWKEISKTCSLVLASDNSLMFEGFYYGMHSVVYDGVKDYEHAKRDFNSPIIHILESDLKNINKESMLESINKSSKLVFKENYLSDYFSTISLEKSKKIFFE